MPTRNPTDRRLAHIEKVYGNRPLVVRGVVDAWMQAMGYDAPRDIDAVTTGLNEGHSAHEILSILTKLKGGPTSTRYDKYLPWLARELARVDKKVESLAGGPVGARSRAVMANVRRSLIQRLRAITDWAEAERVDMSKVRGPDALDAALVWKEKRPTGPVPQGDVVYEFPDGWTVQELRTAEQLWHEGDVMQNCIGDLDVGCYTEAHVRSGDLQIFSLRDPRGRPHAVLAWDPQDNRVIEFKGKQNDSADKAYTERMAAFRLDKLPFAADRVVERERWTQDWGSITGGAQLMAYDDEMGDRVIVIQAPWREDDYHVKPVFEVLESYLESSLDAATFAREEGGGRQTGSDPTPDPPGDWLRDNRDIWWNTEEGVLRGGDDIEDGRLAWELVRRGLATPADIIARQSAGGYQFEDELLQAMANHDVALYQVAGQWAKEKNPRKRTAIPRRRKRAKPKQSSGVNALVRRALK